MDDKYITTRIIRQLIITAGFIPGLWFYIGVNPETEINYAIIDVIAAFMSEQAIGLNIDIFWFGRIVYDFTGIISTIFTLIFAYFTGGGWAILLLFMAFVGGFAINYELSIGIYAISALGFWIFVIAWMVAPFIPVNEEYAL